MKAEDDRLPTTARALAWLGLETLAVGLALAHAALGPALRGFLATNVLDAALRNRLFLATGGACVLVAGACAVALWRTRLTASRLEVIGQRLSPLLLLPLGVVLWDWKLWQSRPLPFLLGVGLFGGLSFWNLSLALAGPSRDGEPSSRVGRWLSRLPRQLRLRSPLFVTVLAGLAYGGYFSFITIKSHYDGYTSTFDLGIFDNVLEHGAFQLAALQVFPVARPARRPFSVPRHLHQLRADPRVPAVAGGPDPAGAAVPFRRSGRRTALRLCQGSHRAVAGRSRCDLLTRRTPRCTERTSITFTI